MIAIAERALRDLSKVALVLFSKLEDRILLLVSCGSEAIKMGLEANRVAMEIAHEAGGRAGGKREYAQGVVRDLSKAKRKVEQLRRSLT